MGKRVLISILLVVVIIGSIAAGAALFFQGRYNNLAEAQAKQSAAAASQNLSDLAAAAGAALEQQPITGDSSVDSVDSSEETAATSVAPISDAAQADASAARARVMLRDMTLEEKICQMLFVTPEALTGYTRVTQSGDTTKAAIEQWPVGGIIYFSTNLVSTDQTTEMIENIQSFSQSATGRRLFIGVDEEGGSVARAADSLGTTQFDDMSVYGEKGSVRIGGIATNKLTSYHVDSDPRTLDELSEEVNTTPKNVYGFGHSFLYADVIDAIKNHRPPYVPLEEGMKALEMVLAVYKSAATGKPVSFPLEDYATLDVLEDRKHKN